MSIEEIRNKISVINSETARLNTQRNQNIGRQETLKKQLNDAFDLYKKNYGVELTAENLQSELDSVTKKKEEELNKIEQILNFIKSGNIAEANKLAGVEEQVSATEVYREVIQSANDEAVTQPVFNETVVPPNAPVASPTPTPSSVVQTPQFQAPPTPLVPETVAPPVPETIAPPVAPPKAQTQKQVLTGAETLDMGMPALEGFTKPSLGSLTPPPTTDTEEKVAPPKSNIQDFGAILNGTAFKPN